MTTLYHDTLMPFGKHKGEPCSEIAAKFPDYMVWLVAADMADLDEKLSEKVNAWTTSNPREASKAISSGMKARRDKTTTATKSTVTNTAQKSVAIQRPENWGGW